MFRTLITRLRLLGILVLGLTARAQTTLSYTFEVGASIPDEGEYLDVRSISLPPGAAGEILDIRVSLSITGRASSTLATSGEEGGLLPTGVGPYGPAGVRGDTLGEAGLQSVLALARGSAPRQPIGAGPYQFVDPSAERGATGGAAPAFLPMQTHLYGLMGAPVPGLGFNGDLFVTLANEHGGFAVLLNRPGKMTSTGLGYGDNGLTVSFSDAAANGDIHLYRQSLGTPELTLASPLTGTWQPDGRATDPSEVLGSDPRPNMLGSFLGTKADGEWRLFVADLSGGGLHHLSSWNVTVSIVPEPQTYLTLGLGLGVLVAWVRRRERRRAASTSPEGTPSL